MKLGLLSLSLVGVFCLLQIQSSKMGQVPNGTPLSSEETYQITERYEHPDYLQIDASVDERTTKDQLRGYIKTILSEVRPSYPNKPVQIWFYGGNLVIGNYDSRKPDREL